MKVILNYWGKKINIYMYHICREAKLEEGEVNYWRWVRQRGKVLECREVLTEGQGRENDLLIKKVRFLSIFIFYCRNSNSHNNWKKIRTHVYKITMFINEDMHVLCKSTNKGINCCYVEWSLKSTWWSDVPQLYFPSWSMTINAAILY